MRRARWKRLTEVPFQVLLWLVDMSLVKLCFGHLSSWVGVFSAVSSCLVLQEFG